MGHRRLLAWLITLGVVFIVFAGTVVTLNLTLYSASGFVGSYLNALARHDLDGALATPGVTLPDRGSHALLRADALGGLDHIRLVSDTDRGNGTHRVVYSYRSDGVSGKTEFTVERDGTHLGLFSAWRFATTPASILEITPQNADTFTANGIAVTAKTGQGVPVDYLALAPSRFSLAHHSTYLVAPPKNVLVEGARSHVRTTVDVRADTAFVKAVQKELDATLAQCVKQQVLLPTGCPMGQEIDDRIQNTPAWSMVKDPVVTIVPGGAPNSWLVPEAQGTAHLVVTVKSIFDGTVSTFDRDVPFTVSYLITFQADGTPVITAEN